MKSTRLLIPGVALFAMAGAFAQSPTNPSQDAASQPQPSSSQPSSSQPSQRGTSFESLDVNSDGRISRSEAEANEGVSSQFAKYDQNGDGFIERSEVNSANHSPPASQPQQ